jgi:hypothetical protein
MASQEGRLLSIPEKYLFDFVKLLRNPDFVTEDDAIPKMVITTHILHWLPPRSSDKMQPLDLGLFGLRKQMFSKMRSGLVKTAQ